MKCRYCDAPLSVEDKVCPLCKREVDLVEKTPKVKKNNTGILVFLIIILLGVIGGGYYYITRPDVVFTTILNKIYKSANQASEEYKQMKVNTDLNISIDAGEEYKEITDLINNIKINSSVNYDLTNEKIVLGLGADYKDKSLVHANMYYEEEAIYIELKDLFDKLIKIDVEVEEEEINITTEDINILTTEVFNGLKESVKVADYITGKENINNEEVNKYTLVINNENKNKLVNAFIDYLLSSNDFIDTVSKISDATKEEVVESLNDSKEEVSDLEEEIHISVYTKKLTNDFVKFDVGTKDKVQMSFTKTGSNVYKLETASFEDTKAVVTITNDVNNNKTSIVYDIEVEDIKAKITMNLQYIYNEKIEMPNTTNSVLMEEMTEEDATEIMNKLMENEGITEIMEKIESMIPEEDYEDDNYNTDDMYYNDSEWEF